MQERSGKTRENIIQTVIGESMPAVDALVSLPRGLEPGNHTVVERASELVRVGRRLSVGLRLRSFLRT